MLAELNLIIFLLLLVFLSIVLSILLMLDQLVGRWLYVMNRWTALFFCVFFCFVKCIYCHSKNDSRYFAGILIVCTQQKKKWRWNFIFAAAEQVFK